LRSRLVVLAALTSWATLLAVESWFRSPIGPHEGELPEQLLWNDRVYRSQPAPSLVPPEQGELPGGVALVAATDYHLESLWALRPSVKSVSDNPAIRLRLVVSTRSGYSGAIPVERITTALAGPGERGLCVELDESGAVTAELPTSSALADWQRRQSAPIFHRLAWLAGLRPYQTNRCLWLGYRWRSQP
jgi:hypothetical protein